ncbi:MAG: PRC-barrel domain-containing protein [Deltaproteobacteria bacterium]|nr:PRC-barrel domain-containing protein [Deltaproteobacteria bacterium]
MEVVTDKGKNIGVVTGIFSTGSNDVYVVKGASGKVLIPATGDVVLKVDVDAGKMVVRLLEGLLPGENEI